MADSSLLQLTISRIDGPVFQGAVRFVTLPGNDGELTLLPHHEPLIATLKQGVITIQTEDTTERFEIDSGTLEVSSNQATVLI